jgi:phosphoserine phosphatase
MTVDEFSAEAKAWIETSKQPRWDRPYTELVYQPMLEVLRYFRDNGYRTYIVTGGGQDFVRTYSAQTYGIPIEQVVGTAGGTSYGYAKDGKPMLTKEPKLLLNDNNAGKPEGIHLMIGRRPCAAFGNSVGDRQMCEYTHAGDGAPARYAGAARRRRARIRLRPGPGIAGYPGRDLHSGALRRGYSQGLDRRQHEGRLE